MTTNAPESRLLAALGTANEWVRFGEVKNGALLTLNGAMLIGAHQLLNWNTQRPFSVDAWLWIASGFWIASMLVGLASFYSRTKTFGFDFGIGSQVENANSIFFGHIADMTREQVLQRLAVDYVAERPQRYLEDIADQLIINSKIARRKFALFNVALFLTITALITPVGTLLFYWGLCDKRL